MDNEHIIAELEMLGTFGDELQLQPIVGGVLNHSFFLRGGSCCYFVKTFNSAHLSVQERRQQFQTQLALSDLELAPRPLYLNKGATFQVDTWVTHQPLNGSLLSLQAQAEYMAHSLFRVHQTEVPARKLDLKADWQHYMQMVDLTTDHSLEEDLQRALVIWQKRTLQDNVLCHNDLSRQHCALAPAHLLFDWEYAAIGNRFFDLAACISVNRMDTNQELALLRQYASLAAFPLDYVVSQCREQYELVKLTNRLWYRAAGEVTHHQQNGT